MSMYSKINKIYVFVIAGLLQGCLSPYYTVSGPLGTVEGVVCYRDVCDGIAPPGSCDDTINWISETTRGRSCSLAANINHKVGNYNAALEYLKKGCSYGDHLFTCIKYLGLDEINVTVDRVNFVLNELKKIKYKTLSKEEKNNYLFLVNKTGDLMQKMNFDKNKIISTYNLACEHDDDKACSEMKKIKKTRVGDIF